MKFESSCISKRDETLWELAKNGEYDTITLISDETSVNVHPLILISYGGYFKNLLAGGFKESKAKEINITKTIPSDVLKPLIQLLYTGSCDLGDDITFYGNLLSALDMLVLHELLLELVEFIFNDFYGRLDPF